MPKSKFIGEKQAAHMLGVSRRFLQMRRMNSLPPNYYKMGYAVRYTIDDLEAFAADSRIELVATKGEDNHD